MRIFLAGDSVTGTGPANVTKYYIENLPAGTLYQKRRGKIARVPEILINTLRSDVVIFSGYSRQNILGMKFAKMIGRPCAYLMHGCVEYENRINREEDEEMCRIERQFIALSDVVYAVSPGFCTWLKEYYPEYAHKFDYIPNGIDESLLKVTSKERDMHMILSVGGGMPRKKIRVICKAVEILRKEYDADMYLTVIGDTGADSEEIDSYPFVDNRGIVGFEESVRLMQTAAVFVQNSCFETFGLAPLEAIGCGCATLITKEAGALCLFENLLPNDVIEDFEDPAEIAQKIKNLREKSNAGRLLGELNWEKNTWKMRSQMLLSKLSELAKMK